MSGKPGSNRCGFYRNIFSDTGGVPGEVSNGALINHPDVDLADPEWNTSGVPWHTLYYKVGQLPLCRYRYRRSEDVLIVSCETIRLSSFANCRWYRWRTCAWAEEQVYAAGVHP